MKNLCIVDLLTILDEGESYIFNIKNYSRIGNKTVDNFNLFLKNDSILSKFNLVVNKDRLNFSVRTIIYGNVKINPITAKRVGLPKIINSKLFKTYTIVKDGKLNVDELELIINNRTYLLFKNSNINMEELDNNTEYFGHHVIISLKGLPLIDDKYNKYNYDDILSLNKELKELEAQQKVVNYFIKKLKETKEETIIEGFNEEQTLILKEHGLDDNLTYIGIDPEIKEAKETYEGKIIEFKIKNYSSIPSVQNVLKRHDEHKPLNPISNLMLDYFLILKENSKNILDYDKLLSFYNIELKDIKSRILKLKIKNIIIKSLLMDSGNEELAIDSDTKIKYNELTIEKTLKTFTR